MTVAYPRKFRNAYSARDVMKSIVRDREIHLITLNRYRYSEQRSCKDLTDLIEQLNGCCPEIAKDLSHHVADESHHAMWLTELLVELGAPVCKPPGSSYIDEFERLLNQEQKDVNQDADDFIISSLVAINVTEKRGCEYFAAHIYALKNAPKTEENRKILKVLERILPEEAAHIQWGNRWLAKIAARSWEDRRKVEQAKQTYTAIEQAAFEASMDITLGAEIRRVENLVNVANTLPIWQRPQYLMERLPETLFAPELHRTRLEAANKVWQRDPQDFVGKFVPMFLSGFKSPVADQSRKRTLAKGM